MTEEEKVQAAAMKLKFDANLAQHAEGIVKLNARYEQATLGGIGMKDLMKPGSLADTYAQARLQFLLEHEAKKGISNEMLKSKSDGYCTGLIMGVFLSELGLAALITREK